jgi:hypothetical protein
MVAGWASGVLTNYGIELRANETIATQRKYFCSMNLDPEAATACTTSARFPTLSVTYNSVPGAPTKISMSPTVATTTGVTAFTSYTPTMSAAVGNADGSKVKLNFEISRNPAFPSEPAFTTWTGSVANVTAGTTGSVTVPSGILSSTHFRWRVRGSVTTGAGGTDYGPWSTYLLVGGNVGKPATPTIACTNYSAGNWTTQITGNETCTLDTTSTDGAGYYWSLDEPTLTTKVIEATNSGAAKTITLTAPAKGEHTLYAIAYDAALNRSTTVASYTFGVGPGAVITPADGDRTQTAVTLTTKSTATRTQITYSWHSGTTATTWTTVPTGDVTPRAAPPRSPPGHRPAPPPGRPPPTAR